MALNKYQTMSVSETPAMSNHSWRFGDLSATELLPLLQRHLRDQEATTHWQLAWLNNESQPIIGFLPKTSWSVYVDACDDAIRSSEKQGLLYNVIKTCRGDDHNKSTSITTAMSYADWQAQLIAYSKEYNMDLLLTKVSDEKALEKSNYSHGLIGFIGYDIAAYELSPTANIQHAKQPCAALGHYDIYLSSADDSSSWTLNIKQDNHKVDTALDDKTVEKIISYLNSLDIQVSDATNPKKTLPSLQLTAQWDNNSYGRAFALTQRYLQQGDCYQVNLTQAWQGQVEHKNDRDTGKLIDYLPDLYRNTQAPFSGYLNVTHHDYPPNENSIKADFELLSCSPELFFTFTTDNNNSHHVTTKPIKGTMPRGLTIKEDAAFKQQLIDSDKDRAENVMIVDLLRNDLGKYAKTGSVKVPQLFAIESFSNVHHMVSTITAELQSDTHPLTVLFGSLPAGSITGAPKKRAVEIIAELEDAPRGAYCGTMGYMNFDGSGQWNVLIRTLQANSKADGDRQVNLWAGGGITIASDCADEYQECWDKVGNLLTVLDARQAR